MLNPTARWSRIAASSYSVVVGMKLFRIAGSSAEFFFQQFLPRFGDPLHRSEVARTFRETSPDLLEAALKSAVSTGLLLIRTAFAAPNLYDGLRATIVPDPARGNDSLVANITLVGTESDAALLRELVDFPCSITHTTDPADAVEIQKKRIGSSEATAWPSHLCIVIDANQHAVSLSDINRRLLDAAIWWIPVRLSPSHAVLGPLIIPYQTACFECAVIRHCAVSSEGRLLHALELGREVTHYAAEPGLASKALRGQALATLASELLMYFTPPCTPGLVGRIVSFSLTSMGSKYHRVLRVPLCPACGPSTAPRHPWRNIALTVEQVIGAKELA